MVFSRLVCGAPLWGSLGLSWVCFGFCKPVLFEFIQYTQCCGIRRAFLQKDQHPFTDKQSQSYTIHTRLRPG